MEYSFFNPVPEFMNEELNISSCSELESLYNNTDNNYTSKRGLQSGIGNNSNTDYEIGIDEIIINVKVNWREIQTQIINGLYVKRDIDIFNSSDDFIMMSAIFSPLLKIFQTFQQMLIYIFNKEKKFFISLIPYVKPTVNKLAMIRKHQEQYVNVKLN